MASVYEVFRSREGGGVGVFGSQSRQTIWHVKTDADGDDPVKTMWATPPGPKLGDPFPAHTGSQWVTRDDGLVAIGFNYGRRLSRLTWEVFVTYGLPVFFNTQSSAWTMAISASLTQEQVRFDADKRPIGPLAYQVIPKELISQAVVDVFKVRVADPDTTQEFKEVYMIAPPPKGGSDSDDPRRRQPDERARYSTPALRTANAGTIQLTKALANFPLFARTGIATKIVNNVNTEDTEIRVNLGAASDPSNSAGSSTLIRIAPKHTLKMQSFTVNPEPGSMIGQLVPGTIWRVNFAMEFNPNTWWHRQIHTYQELGGEAPVTYHKVVRTPDVNPGDLVEERHRLYDFADFTALFASFA